MSQSIRRSKWAYGRSRFVQPIHCHTEFTSEARNNSCRLAFDAFVINGWLLYRNVKDSSTSFLVFYCEITQQVLNQYGTTKRLSGRPSLMPLVNDALHYDRNDYWPEPLPSRFFRCKKCGNRRSPKFFKCEVPCIQSVASKHIVNQDEYHCSMTDFLAAL